MNVPLRVPAVSRSEGAELLQSADEIQVGARSVGDLLDRDRWHHCAP